MAPFLGFISRFFSRDMGIDLGTANTLVYVKGEGIVLSEPSVVAIRRGSNQVRAVGKEARDMIGRTPGNIIAIRPMKDGVIADFDITQHMLSYFIRKVHHRNRFNNPELVIGVPSGITGVEQRAVRESATMAGARRVYLIEEPMAAAIGAGMPVGDAIGNMIVDIGGGTTEVAVVSLGGIVVKKSIRVAGDELDQAIIDHIKRIYNLMIGERTAENIKIRIGSAFPLDQEESMEIRGRDLLEGLPKSVVITSEEIRDCLSEPISKIVDAVRQTLERTPPELASDIIERGVMLAGGGSLVRGLDTLISQQTGLPVHIADSPLTAVVMGAGRIVDNLSTYRDVLAPEAGE